MTRARRCPAFKRHVAVDTQGLPHAIHATTADVTDPVGALAMFGRHRGELNRVQKVPVDGGYAGKSFVWGGEPAGG